MIRRLTIWMATPGLLLAEYKDCLEAKPDYATDFRPKFRATPGALGSRRKNSR